MLVKPEEVGLSSPRLARIREHFQRYVEAGQLAGTVTLVARRGRMAYLESQGHLEIERRLLEPVNDVACDGVTIQAGAVSCQSQLRLGQVATGRRPA